MGISCKFRFPTLMLIILGANPLVSTGSLLSAPNIKKRLQDIQSRGGEIINIDPRFTETSEKSDQHLFIQSGTDLFLLLGMLQILVKDDLIDLGRFKSATHGLDEVISISQEYTLEQVSLITGFTKEEVSELTRAFAKAEKAVIYGRKGACT